MQGKSKLNPLAQEFIPAAKRLNPLAQEFIPARKRLIISYQEEGGPSHMKISPDEPTYINTFKPGGYFSCYKRVTSDREREEWRDHADIEPFKWHDPAIPCPCLEYWRRPPISFGSCNPPPITNAIEELSSDEEGSASEDDRGKEESDDSSDGTLWARPRKERANKLTSRVARRLTRATQASNAFMDPNLWKGLHEDLLLHVFAMLPFRSLSRLRSVCKYWNSMIYQHEFQDLSPRHPAEVPFCIIFDHLVQGYSVYNPASHIWYRLPRSFFSFSARKACLLATAGGLCLFEGMGYEERALFVVNPINKSEKRLPTLPSTGNMDEFVYVEMAMYSETFRIIIVDSITYENDLTEDDDDDDPDEDDDLSGNLHATVNFQIYDSRMNSWERKSVEVDEKYKDIVSTAIYDGHLYCLIRTIDNRHIVYRMGNQADERESWENTVTDVIGLPDFDHLAFLHLFEQRGDLMICGKSRSSPDLGVRIWQLDAGRMRWREVQRAPAKLRNKLLKLGWRSRVVVHGDYMWISGMNRELVLANIASKSWCPVPPYTLGCSHDCSWHPKRRTSRYRCTLFLFEPRLDLEV